ncbi:MAG: hypothetical protein INR70_14245 [Parafilimonas terrae]|nr:hypothetical protein [Parafilimonas terrae]
MNPLVLKALEEFLAALRAIFSFVLELLLMPFRLIGAAIHRPSPLQIAAEAMAAQAPIPTGPAYDEIPPTYEQRRGREKHELASLIRKHAENAALGFPRHDVPALPPIIGSWVYATCTREDLGTLISAPDWRIHDHVLSAGDDRRGYRGLPPLPAMCMQDRKDTGRSGKGGPARPAPSETPYMSVDEVLALMDAPAAPRMR